MAITATTWRLPLREKQTENPKQMTDRSGDVLAMTDKPKARAGEFFSSRVGAHIVLNMLSMVAVPAGITPHTVCVPVTFRASNSDPTLHGNMVSLLRFIWIAVAFATAIVFETVKLWQVSSRRAREAFLGSKGNLTDS